MNSSSDTDGATPLDDISGLKLKHVRTRGQLAVAEAENVLNATVKYLAKKPSTRLARFDLAWSLKLHREMFGNVWRWAGQTRQTNLNIGVDALHVATRLKDLLDDLRFWEENWPDVTEQAATLHHRAVQIHPFLNGNGRWSRMMANIWLAQHDTAITAWPEQTIGVVSTIRKEYLAAMKKRGYGVDQAADRIASKVRATKNGLNSVLLSQAVEALLSAKP